MERVRLTIDRITKAKCPPSKQQAFLWDTDSPRLAVRTTRKGAKSFIFEGKLERSTIRRTIGDVRVWNLDDARKEANRLQTLIDQGIDPRELDKEQKDRKAAEKVAKAEAKQKAKDRQRYTLKALLKEYVKHLEAQGKRKSAGDAASAFKCHVSEPLPDIASAPANEITPHQIANIVRQVIEQGKERRAGSLRSYMSAAFNAAKKAPFHPDLPSAFIPFNIEHNPVEPVGTLDVNAGERHLAAEELKVYITALGNGLADMALNLALYSGGQRMAQLLRAKATDYDQKTKILTLLDGKGARKRPRIHELPLGPVAASIADLLLQNAEESESDYLFASRGSVMHESTPGKRVKEISDEMNREQFNLRDIRRTVETMLASLRISKDDRAQVLSHGISGVQDKHYDRHHYIKEKREALRKWERHLEGIVNDKPKEKVVKIR